MAATLAKGARITGSDRAELAGRLATRYAAGESIRAIADDTGRSFGFVHGLIKESGTDLRGRGGATRGAAARTTTSTTASAGATPSAEARTSASPKKVTGKKAKDSAKKKDVKKDGGKKDTKKGKKH